MNRAIKPEELKSICIMLEQDLATSRQLLTILQEENQSTQARDYENMSRLIAEKPALLDSLQTNTELRNQWLQSISDDKTKESWDDLLASLNNDDLQAQWQDIKETIVKCQQMNTSNGTLIHRGLNSHQQLIHIMCGNTEQGELYNARGGTGKTSYLGTMARA